MRLQVTANTGSGSFGSICTEYAIRNNIVTEQDCDKFASWDCAEESMPRAYRPISITLTAEQAAEIMDPEGVGGQQDLAIAVREQLQGGNLTIELSHPLPGKLVRYMTSYGPGGFQDRLRWAFRAPLIKMLQRPLRGRQRTQPPEDC
jgi:hypothetical protein